MPECALHLNDAIELASGNTEDGWKRIDGALEECSNDQEYFAWAVENLSNPDSNLRDLAASILERTDFDLTDEVVSQLFALMG